MSFLGRIFNKVVDFYGVDLGTGSTLVYKRGRGIMVDDHSCIAVNKKTARVVAVGGDAYNMSGRTPAHINIYEPVVNSVVSDYDYALKMVSLLMGRSGSAGGVLGVASSVVVNVPNQITNVEIEAVVNLFKDIGFANVYLLRNPIAAAIGVEEDVFGSRGVTIIDAGAGSIDIATISLGSIVSAVRLDFGGNQLTNDLVDYVRREFKVEIGRRSAEEVKLKIANMYPTGNKEAIVRGRDLETGNPREIVVSDVDVYNALSERIDSVIDSVKKVVDDSPPEIVSDILNYGINCTGGLVAMPGFAKRIESGIGVPVVVPEAHKDATIRGIIEVIDNFENYESVLLKDKDGLPFV